jgi:hypothetical protein
MLIIDLRLWDELSEPHTSSRPSDIPHLWGGILKQMDKSITFIQIAKKDLNKFPTCR